MIEIVPYRSNWVEEFAEIGSRLREAMGGEALAIHHIGSTSVPGLAAKDVIDIQITVDSLGNPAIEVLTQAGFLPVPEIFTDHCPPGMSLASDQLAKRMVRGSARRAHIHVRVDGRFNQRYALLCRDYLRAQPLAANAYAEIKRQLASCFPEDVNAYYAIKDPVFDTIMCGAYIWKEAEGWSPSASDA